MNKFKISQLLLALAFLAAPAAAQDFDSLPSVKDIVSQARTAEVTAPLPALPQDAEAVKEWTIMVFMNGKNNLSSHVIRDMNEMEKYGPTANINIVTQAARIGDATGDWVGVRRYLVTADGDNPALSSIMLSDLGNVDMGDYRQLVEFGKWAKQNYPAKKYMLIVWNHGDGWKNQAFGKPGIKGISYDDESGHGISTVNLGLAVREMGGVEIYASDACLMQMAEVAYELKDAARITVGSEETEPGDGWAYDYFLARVHSNKTNLTPDVMAAAAVQGYKAFYGEKKTNATQSALRTSGMNGFRAMMDQWAGAAMKEDKAMLKVALSSATSFSGADSRDLIHFMELVYGRTSSNELKWKTVNAMNYIYDHVLLDNGATGDRFKKAYGIGIYLPAYGYEAAYGNLAWSKDGQWDEFVQWLTAK